ncbi:MAG: hypothetical protein BWY09_01210 [Candidatus Hydrogenedentes bacterium ADurb.Bin179]|nr:MAG: hypothetical protein BWY09_01210 [Candidatus Hydrogenedentes bacterium ADurb.Bin179]
MTPSKSIWINAADDPGYTSTILVLHPFILLPPGSRTSPCTDMNRYDVVLYILNLEVSPSKGKGVTKAIDQAFLDRYIHDVLVWGCPS